MSDLRNADDPIWIDEVWLDTVVVAGLTCFILCLMGLSQVPTAKMGILYGVVGMIALVVAYWVDDTYTYDEGTWLIAASMAPGAVAGLISAVVVEMTSLPEMVGAYNGFGGLAAAVAGYGLYLDPGATFLVRDGIRVVEQTDEMLIVQAIALWLSIVIGLMTFTGSMVATLKLHGTISSKSVMIPARGLYTAVIFAVMVVFGVLAFAGDQTWNDRQAGIAYLAIVGAAAGLYGYTAVMAIGGGDMPVSISFLNSLSGFSTTATGFMLFNKALVVAGAFVGCSGIILTIIMCKAMNRNVTNVLLGGFGEGSSSEQKQAKSKDDEEGDVTIVEASEVVETLTSAKSVIIVPGYGMAVAKAQHAIAELTTRLRRLGIMVRFAIHPVAGRMPGHMNVLLAEAHVPYDITVSMDQINQDFPSTDVVVILGGNDIVNPAAQTDPDSPIAGMPVLEVWKAKTTIVMKRSLRVGYAGIENPLFLKPNNRMFLGDAKESTEKLVALVGNVNKDSVSDTDGTHLGDEETAVPKISKEEKEMLQFAEDLSKLREAVFLKVGVIREVDPDEEKIAIVPSGCKDLMKQGIQVYVQSGAGEKGQFFDSMYESNGAIVLSSAQQVLDTVDILVKIRAPAFHPDLGQHEVDRMSNKTLISFLGPRTEEGKTLMARAVEHQVNLLAVDAIPRISRAQSLDVLSSQAKVAGYRAVIQAAYQLQKFCNGEITSAGSFEPSKFLVVGAGVAGLAAISTASNLGAHVRAFDTRLETKEQVESLGGHFLVLDFGNESGGDAAGYAKVMSDAFYEKEMALFLQQAKEVDVIITTAAIPGRPAPVLIQAEHVNAMKPGGVIVDLAGGNCALTRPKQTYVHNGITIIGSDMTNQAMNWQASTMYSNNIVNLFGMLCKDRQLNWNANDPVIRGMTCVWNGDILFPPPESMTATAAAPQQNTSGTKNTTSPEKKPNKPSFLEHRLWDLASVRELLLVGVLAIFFAVVAAFAPVVFSQQLGYFILAAFLGYYLIENVNSALFSPLMSTSNALSGVVILGGLLMISVEIGSPTSTLGCISTCVAAINVFGGFAVSYRMLLMFNKEKL